MTRDFDDIFDMMDDMFGNTKRQLHHQHTSKYIDTRASERIIDNDKVYYTFTVKELNKEEISLDSYEDRLELIISKGLHNDTHVIRTPYIIFPKKTIAKYNNGLLDVTTFVDTKKSNRVEVE